MQPDSSFDALLADLTSGDEARAERAAIRLAEVGEAALERLVPLLHSKDVDHRWWAVRTLGQMHAPRTDWLIEALRDSSSEVRAAAALALSAHPVEKAAPALVMVLDDADAIVSVLAVNAVVALGGAAVPQVLEAFPQASPRGRIQMMRALAEIRDHRAIRLMMQAVEGDSAMLRYWAEVGLERLGLDMVYIRPE